MSDPIVLSHFQTNPLLAAHAAGQLSALTSLDLGLSQVEVGLSPEGVSFPGAAVLPWDQVERISRAENQCFLVEDGRATSIQIFSQTTNWLRSLMPTSGAPTMLVAGFPMHRIKGTDPWRDTQLKVAAAGPVAGHVLDTATGLGYTAIAAARTASHVTTVELDPASLEVARLNPWSRDLFDNPRITQVIADVSERILDFPDGAFSVILHDPPTLALAGELYSTAFYHDLWRVLTPRGRLFHYIGDPASGYGKRITTSVVRRLKEAGFRRVEPHPEAFGVTASK